MHIVLRPIDKDNWQQTARLKVTEHQLEWVMPNWFSMLQAQHEFGVVRAIFADETVVGLGFYGTIPGDDRWLIIRLMIDHTQQGKGYGREAMKAIIHEMRQNPLCTDIYVSIVPVNKIVARLYKNLGFVDLHQLEEGKQVFCLSASGK